MDIKYLKQNLNNLVKLTNRKLFIENSKFILSGCTIRKNENGFYYQAELQDLNNSRSILICRLEDIEKLEEKP